MLLPPIILPIVVVLVRVELEPSLIVEPSKTCLPPVTLPDTVVFFRVELLSSLIVDPSKTCFPSVIMLDVVVFVKVEFKITMIACKRRIMLLSWAPLCSVMRVVSVREGDP